MGLVTKHLSQYNDKTLLELPLKGFGGKFFFQQNEGEFIGFIAGGVGITPLLAQTNCLDLARRQICWTVKAEDLGLVLDSFDRAPALNRHTKLFAIGDVVPQTEDNLLKLEAMDVILKRRRIMAADLQLGTARDSMPTEWYICTGAGLRGTLLIG